MDPAPQLASDTLAESAGGAVATSLIPPQRLGRLLSSARAHAGLTLEEVAIRSHGDFSLAALSSVELGTRSVTDAEATVLADLYGLETSSLVPPRSRLVVDLDRGFIGVDEHRTALREAKTANGDVLARYLTMVYAMRQIDPGTDIPLRVEDLDVLGRALHLRPAQVQTNLEALMASPVELFSWRDRILTRRVLIPAAGVLVAALGIGSLVLIQGNESVPSKASTTPAHEVSAAVPVPVEIGSAVVVERGDDGAIGETSVRTGEEAEINASSDVSLLDAQTLER